MLSLENPGIVFTSIIYGIPFVTIKSKRTIPFNFSVSYALVAIFLILTVFASIFAGVISFDCPRYLAL